MANFIPAGTKGPSGIPLRSARRRNFIPEGEPVSPAICVCGADFSSRKDPVKLLRMHIINCKVANNGKVPEQVAGPVNDAVVVPAPEGVPDSEFVPVVPVDEDADVKEVE